jgi:hypothetical protein
MSSGALDDARAAPAAWPVAPAPVGEAPPPPRYTDVSLQRPWGAAALCACCGLPAEGNTIRCWGARGGRWPATCVVGPAWNCNLCTWALVLAPSVPFLLLVAPRMHVVVVVLGALMTTWVALMLAMTAWSDPGFERKRGAEEAEAERVQLLEAGVLEQHSLCPYCNVWRPVQSGTHHCSESNLCVREYDHLCPWVGTAVGGGNLRTFYGFVYGIFALLAFEGISMLVWLVGR